MYSKGDNTTFAIDGNDSVGKFKHRKTNSIIRFLLNVRSNKI